MRLTFQNTPIGTRIGLALTLPILGLLLFALWIIADYQRISTDARDFRELAQMAPAIGTLVHELQHERSVSARFLGAGGPAYETALPARQAATDQGRAAFAAAHEMIIGHKRFDARLAAQTSAAQSALQSLQVWRRAISGRTVTFEESSAEYRATIEALIGTAKVMLVLAGHSELTRSINAYISLMQAKEIAAIESASGPARFVSGRIDPASQANLIGLIDRQQMHLDQFHLFAAPESDALFRRTLDRPEAAEIEHIRRLAIFGDGKGRTPRIDGARWFELLEWKVDQMKLVEDALATDLIAEAQRIEESARSTAALVNTATVLILILATVSATLLARGIIDPIARMTSAMSKLAADDEAVEIADHLRGDEIGDMARAAMVFRDNVGRIAQARERLKSEAILRLHYSALASILQGVLIIDANKQIIYANAALQKITGYAEAEMLGRTPEFLYGPDTDPAALAALRAALSAGDTQPHIVLSYRKDGTPFWTEVSLTPVSDSAGRPTHIVSVVRDITDSRNIEQELRIAAIAFESLHAMMVTDSHGTILRVNRAFTEATGYSAAEMIGKPTSVLKSGRHEPQFYADMWRQLIATGSWEGEIWDRRKNGEVYPKWQTISSVRDSNGEITHYVAAFTDISERKLAEEEIRRLAFYDSLTGLPNRRLLLDRLQQAIAASARSGRNGALLFIDLDQFKQLNDTCGHDVGDLLLIEVANRLQATLRACDTAARFGGDEFVVMLEALSEIDATAMEQTRTVGDKILSSLNEPYLLAGMEHRSSPSIGVTLIQGRNANATELLKRADLAMYKAKAAGRNTLRFYEPEMTPGALP